MINKPPPFRGLNIRISIIILIKGRELINQARVWATKGDTRSLDYGSYIPQYYREFPLPAY